MHQLPGEASGRARLPRAQGFGVGLLRKTLTAALCAIRPARLADRLDSSSALRLARHLWQRVHAELTLGQSVAVGHQAVELLMRRAGIEGISGRPKFRRVPGVVTAADRVERQFHRDNPDELWVTDVTEHPTREGKVYCAVVLDAWSRRVIGWSIDGSPSTVLVTNALGMAIDQRRPTNNTVIHSDQGTQFTPWAFTRRAVDSGGPFESDAG